MLIDLVKRSDNELENYIIARQDVFKEYIDRITSIVNNWDDFENKLLDEKIYNILDVIHDYYFKYGHLLNMDESDAVKYFADILKLTDQFKELDPITFEVKSLFSDPSRTNFNDQKMIKDLTPIINNIMQGKDIYEAKEESEASKNSREKVVDSRKKYNITEFKPKKI